jgi:tetratricopeptide (TPR) repeat protein
MSSLSNTRLLKPKDWQDFERKTRALFACVLADPNTQMNGRTGQPQHGVDIWGYRNGDPNRLVGIQCKQSDDPVTVAELEAELEKAKGFRPPIKQFFLVTTAPRDARIQQRARALTENLSQTERPIFVAVWGWQDVEEQAAKYVDAHRAFDPTFNPYAEGAKQEILAKAERDKQEILDAISRDRGVPALPLRAILEKLGEAGMPDYKIPERFDASVGELLRLRADLAQLKNEGPELAAVRQEALALIDRGELDGARAALNRGRPVARALREQGSRSEAQLLADEARIDHLQLAYSAAAAKYAEAAALVAPFDRYSEWNLLIRQASALLDQGDEFGDNEALVRAIAIYRDAAGLISRADFPLDWAMTQNDLGNALEAWGERETDTARLEEAVKAYRKALEEYTRERAPLAWAGTQNNLGSALRAIGERGTDTARLKQAVAAYREALKEWTPESAPLNWAGAQSNLGNALAELADREGGTTLLNDAIVACREALKHLSRERAPLQWGMTQFNLGTALQMLGELEGDTARLEEAVRAFRKALEELTHKRVPVKWAMTQNNLGNALWRLGERKTGRLEEAAAAFREALTERTRERAPFEWAMTQGNLGNALAALGNRDADTARLDEAVEAYRKALEEYTRERSPFQRAKILNNLGNALVTLGEREGSTTRLEEAVATYREALEEYTGERAPLRWAIITGKQGEALMLLAERLGDLTTARIAVHQISLAFATVREAYDMPSAAYFETVLGKAVALLNRLTHC